MTQMTKFESVIRSTLSELFHPDYRFNCSTRPSAPDVVVVHIWERSPSCPVKANSFSLEYQELMINSSAMKIVDLLKSRIETAIEELKSMK